MPFESPSYVRRTPSKTAVLGRSWKGDGTGRSAWFRYILVTLVYSALCEGSKILWRPRTAHPSPGAGLSCVRFLVFPGASAADEQVGLRDRRHRDTGTPGERRALNPLKNRSAASCVMLRLNPSQSEHKVMEDGGSFYSDSEGEGDPEVRV